MILLFFIMMLLFGDFFFNYDFQRSEVALLGTSKFSLSIGTIFLF